MRSADVWRRFWFDGLTPVEDIVGVLGSDLPMGDWNTVAGLFMGLSGSVARVGDTVQVPDATLRVKAMRGRRITRVEITSAA